MNDKELADAVVALGVGCARLDKYQVAPVTDNVREYGSAKWFVRDWRVAGALMERVYEKRYSFMVMQMPDEKPMMTIQQPLTAENDQKNWAAQVVNESLPRAIIEACVEALT